VRRVITIPNLLTGYRFAVILPLLFCLQPGASTATSLLAFSLFLSAALTDLADGYFARKHDSVTVLGKLMDPLADKVLVTTALVMLIPMGRVAAWLTLLIVAREIFITGLRGVAASSGIVISASGLGKVKSVLQYTALSILIFPPAALPIPFLHALGAAVLYVSLILTLWSGIDYFFRFQKVYLG
jgi:CDP-diacylglycerol--glycerol-3-phosphate 3-phosphatidyltransferase